ncbi:MAG: glycosyltransferase family 2 protein [Actinobacteria bacterium]|nr:glycosyltransferase family 2 protein [Actinomycetota bacterium]
MWRDQRVSLVLPTYNEVGSIERCIREFEALGIVDQIVVVNNNAAPGTSESVARTTAREVYEPHQGYGAAIQRGLQEADGDLICLCEPDGTFVPADLLKLLPFIDDVDVVLGSRTVTTFIWSGANMGFLLRWGNWAVAKMIEVLFNTPYLSDVGCTFRVLRRAVVGDLHPQFRTTGSAFGLELLMLSVVRRHRFVQVPVKYLPRVGVSSVTGDRLKTFLLGARMVALVLAYRARFLGPRTVRDGAPSPPFGG